jgi:hypothetical protein
VLDNLDLDVVLFVLKIVFLVLLYLFVFLVVRRAAASVLAGAGARQAPDVVLPEPVPPPPPPATPSERRERRDQRKDARTSPGETLDLLTHVNPRLVVVASPVVAPETTFDLEGWMMIGRAPTSDIVLDDPFVSQTHARVVPRGQMYVVEDLGSTNGTYVNGKEVVEAQLLLDAELRVGETVFRYEE